MNMKKHNSNLDFATQAVHAGTKPIDVVTRPEVPPIYQTSVFAFKDIDQVDEVLEGDKGYIYSRYNNPSRQHLADILAELCGAEAAVTTASGMGAIAAALLTLLKTGDHVVASDEVYGGTYTLFAKDLPALGIEVTFADVKNKTALEAAIQDNTKILYVETITNPTMKVTDFKQIVALGKVHRLKVFVDNTFASPAVFRPLAWGVDVELHSMTKYINGHSDVTAGLVLGSAEFCAEVNERVKSYGASLSPFDAWLVLRGVKTLPLRMERISQNAYAIADFLHQQPQVNMVNYPTHPSHSQYQLATRQFPNGCGGMLSFELQGGLKAANEFIRGLNLIEYVPSLAGVTTTLLHPVSTSHRPMPAEQRRQLGIGDGLIRLSVGIELVDDIVADIKQALQKI